VQLCVRGKKAQLESKEGRPHLEGGQAEGWCMGDGVGGRDMIGGKDRIEGRDRPRGNS
jgi:hypothetical protein